MSSIDETSKTTIKMEIPNGWGSIYKQTWWGDVPSVSIFGDSYAVNEIPEDYFCWKVDVTIAGDSGVGTIEIPTSSMGAASVDIDWGDGNTDSISSPIPATISHTYATAGVYYVSGTFPSVGSNSLFPFFNGGSEAHKVVEILAMGNAPVGRWRVANGKTPRLAVRSGVYGKMTPTSSASSLFRGGYVEDSSWLDLSNRTSLNYNQMFQNVSELKAVPVGFWEVPQGNLSSNYNFQSAFSGITNPIDFACAFNLRNYTGTPNISNFMLGSSMTKEAYDATLNDYYNQAQEATIPSGLIWDFGSSQHSGDAAAAKDYLVNTLGWTILDGGLADIGFRFDVDTDLVTGDTSPTNQVFLDVNSKGGSSSDGVFIDWGDGDFDLVSNGITHDYGSRYTGEIKVVQAGAPTGMNQQEAYDYCIANSYQVTLSHESIKITEIKSWGGQDGIQLGQMRNARNNGDLTTNEATDTYVFALGSQRFYRMGANCNYPKLSDIVALRINDNLSITSAFYNDESDDVGFQGEDIPTASLTEALAYSTAGGGNAFRGHGNWTKGLSSFYFRVDGVTFTNCFTDCGFDVDEVDAALQSWANDPQTADNITLGMGNLQYSDQSSYDALVAKGWTLTGLTKA